MLPGDGPLHQRVDELKKQFEVPNDKLSLAFNRAIKECRDRTKAFVELLPNETFNLEYAKKQPWSAYNWYKGNALSLIQVNTDFPTQLSRAVNFPCIEKYLRRCRKYKISTAPLNLRLVRVELPSGQVEILVSSLTDQQAYPTSIFADLYHQRWGVEEDYKVLKSRLNIENYSSLSVEGILQDLHAKLLTKNLASVVAFDAKMELRLSETTRRYEYKINITFAINQLKDNVVRFMMKLAGAELSRLLISKISKSLSVIRPNRKFYRRDKRFTPNKYPMSYKRVC